MTANYTKLQNYVLQMHSIQVIPATVYLFEATNLLQAMALAINLEPSDKLNRSCYIIDATVLSAANPESQPSLRGIKPHPARTRIRMPGRQQVGLIAKYKTTIA
mgnify:FL=1